MTTLASIYAAALEMTTADLDGRQAAYWAMVADWDDEPALCSGALTAAL